MTIKIFLIFQFLFAFTASVLIYPDNTFSAGRLNYRNLLVDPKSTSLYVGAKGNFFKLWLYNVNDTSSSNLFAKRRLETIDTERDECIQVGNSEESCENWVRLQFIKSNGQILLCTSNAMKPKLYSLDGNSLADVEYPKTIIGVCSPHGELNTTAVFVEFGNPDDIPSVYSGVRTGISLENHLIYRPPLVFNNKEVHPSLRTIYTDNKWLNEPQFVASFEANQYVYFFFREISSEAENCGRNIYSRVARVCKNDLGGKNVLRQVWSSYVKARLNCSISSQVPFHFNYIQSVSAAQINTETYFYSTFTSSETQFQSSAICAFSLSNINQVLDNGAFLEPGSSSHRPGSCVSDSQKLTDEEIHFAKSHLLLSDSIPSGGPLITFNNRALTTILTNVHNDDVVVFALNLAQKIVYKILHWREQQQTRLLGTYRLDNEEKIRSLAILPGEYLFVADDQRVSQYRLGQCFSHTFCQNCASDPYCSWSTARSECYTRDSAHSTAVGWITSVQNSHRCLSYVKSVSKTLFPGDGILLQCLDADSAETSKIEWQMDRNPIEDSSHIQRTLSGGLVLLNVTKSHSGTYQCLNNGVPVSEYIIMVDDKDCAKPKTVEQFHSANREWCKKYDQYKTNLSKWQRLYDENSECPRVPPQLKNTGKQSGISFI